MKPRPWKHWLGRLDYWKSIRLDIGESFFKYNGVVCSGRLFTPSLNVFKYPSGYSPGKRGLILQLTLPEWEVVWETSLFPYNMNYCLIQWHLLIPWPFKKRQYQLQTISANLRMPTETGRKKKCAYSSIAVSCSSSRQDWDKHYGHYWTQAGLCLPSLGCWQGIFHSSTLLHVIGWFG